MRFLRTASTNQLLAVITGLVVAIVAGAAIAVAAAGPGPIPKRERLATALHRALSASTVNGISADITFTNNLIDSSDLQGSDPILSGASGRLWLANHRFRLELQSNNGDVQVVVNQRSFWVSDPSSHTVYEGRLPAAAAKHHAHAHAHAADHGIPSIAQIQTDLNKLMRHVNVSGAVPSDVAGHAAYTVTVSPKHDGGLLGSVQLAWDAARGLPLRFAVYARGNSSPVLQLEATGVSYGRVPTSDFNVAAPVGAKVVRISRPTVASSARMRSARGRLHHARRSEASGVRAVAARLPFRLAAPRSLVGLPRRSTELLDWGGKPAALVAYGQNLGGIAVIEQTKPAHAAAAKSASQSQSGGQPGGLNLPTVSIDGATGQELDTALGTVVHFSRGGVAYTVLGSVPAAAADAVARAL